MLLLPIAMLLVNPPTPGSFGRNAVVVFPERFVLFLFRCFFFLQAACVPVIISDELRPSLPFAWKLDYDSFAFFVPEAEFKANPVRTVEKVYANAQTHIAAATSNGKGIGNSKATATAKAKIAPTITVLQSKQAALVQVCCTVLLFAIVYETYSLFSGLIHQVVDRMCMGSRVL